jgi:hypothetical protein
MAAPATRDLVVVDAGLGVGDVHRGQAAPAARGRVLMDVGRLGSSPGHGGTAAPATRDLVVVNAGLVVSDVNCGQAAPAARGLVIMDVGRVGSGRGRGGTAARRERPRRHRPPLSTSLSLTLAVGRQRQPLVASSLSTLVASSAVLSWWDGVSCRSWPRRRRRWLPRLQPCRGGTAAPAAVASSSLAAAVGRRRPPFVASSY